MKNLLKVFLLAILAVFVLNISYVYAEEQESEKTEGKVEEVLEPVVSDIVNISDNKPEKKEEVKEEPKEEVQEETKSETPKEKATEEETKSEEVTEEEKTEEVKVEETKEEEKNETVSETSESDNSEVTEEVVVETLNTAETEEEVKPEETKEEPKEKSNSKKSFAKGASDVIQVTINIYVNNKFKGTGYTDSEEFPELEYGSLQFGLMYGDAYGEFQSGNVTINGQKGYFFPYDGGASIFRSDFMNFEPSDVIVVNLYYNNPDEEEEVVNGTITLNISDGKKPVSGYEIVVNGKKGVDTDSKTIVSDENGIATGNEFDISYTWTYEISGYTFVVSFDENNSWTSDHVIKVEEPIIETNLTAKLNIYGDNKLVETCDLLSCNYNNSEEKLKNGKVYGPGNRPNQYRFVKAVLTLNGTEVRNATIPDDKKTWAEFEPFELLDGELVVDLYYEYTEEEKNKEYTITVQHQFIPQGGNTSVNGYIEGAIIIDGVSYKAKAGDSITLRDIWEPVNGEFELAEGNEFIIPALIKLGNDYYEMHGGKYASGGDNNSLLGSIHDINFSYDTPFEMIHRDITVIFDYMYVYPVYIVTVKYIDDDTKEEFSKDVPFKYPNNTPNEDNTLTWDLEVKKAFKGTSDLNGKQKYDMSMFAEDGRWFRTFENYEFVRVEGDPFTGESNSDKIIYMYYSHLKSVVRVHHVDEEGNYIETDENGKEVECYQELPGNVGDKFKVSAIEIDGYINTVDGEYMFDENIVEGEYTLEDQDIYFYYTKLPVGDDEEEEPEEEEKEVLPPQTGFEENFVSVFTLLAIMVLLIIKK